LYRYRRKLVQKGLGKARVAVARKLGIRLWIMLRDQIDYQEFCRRGQKQSGAACAGMPEVGNGANRHRLNRDDKHYKSGTWVSLVDGFALDCELYTKGINV